MGLHLEAFVLLLAFAAADVHAADRTTEAGEAAIQGMRLPLSPAKHVAYPSARSIRGMPTLFLCASRRQCFQVPQSF